MLEVIY